MTLSRAVLCAIVRSVIILSVVMLSVIMLSVVILSVIMLSVIILSVIMQSVVAPKSGHKWGPSLAFRLRNKKNCVYTLGLSLWGYLKAIA